MSKTNKEGSVVSSYFNTRNYELNGKDIYDMGIKIAEGQVERVHFRDENTNISKTEVEYDVSVRDERGGQTVYRNVKKASFLGGANDFDVTVLEPNDFAFKGKLDVSNSALNKNGTRVIIGFLYKNLSRPFILGAFQHYKILGPTKEKGVSKFGEYRGIAYEIDKDGALTITYQGNRAPDGKLEREDTGPTTININKDGILSVTDKEGNTIKIDRVTKSISIISKENLIQTVGKDLQTSIQGNQTLSIQGEQTQTITGNSTTEYAGNKEETITGENNVSVQGDKTDEFGGNWTINVTGDAKLTCNGNIEFSAVQIQLVAQAILELSGSSVKLGGGGPGVARLGDAVIAGIFPGIITSGSGIVNSG